MRGKTSAKTVEVIGVSKQFGVVTAVRPLSLKVEAGEFLTLLGPSGCGKTTLLRMIAGLEQVSSGEIRVGADDVTALPPNRRDTSIMFQDYALFPHKSVADNISYGPRMHGKDRAICQTMANEWLERIGLAGFGDRLPHQLSGGQRQRVALARALILEPAVLLLDEPLGALDANLRRQLQGELRRLHRDVGLTFIAVTHDQDEAIMMSDRIAVMRDGQIEQLDTPLALYDRPRTAFVARFVGRCNIIEGVVSGFDGGKPIVQTAALGKIVAKSSANVQSGSTVSLALRPEAVTVSGQRSAHPFASLRVREVVITGPTCRIELVAPDNTVIDAELPRPAGLLSVGSNVHVTIADGSAAILEQKP